MAQEGYSVTITGVADSEALELTARFLALVFKNRSYDSITAALGTLPLLLTTDVSREAAETLRKHLEARGTKVLVEARQATSWGGWREEVPIEGLLFGPDPREDPATRKGQGLVTPLMSAPIMSTPVTSAPVMSAPVMSAPRVSTPLESENEPEAGTSYTFSRPGVKDRVFCR